MKWSVVLSALAVIAVAALEDARSSDGRHGGFQLEEATISDIQHALLSKRLTTEQLVRGYLARIKAYNGTCVSEPEGILGPVTTIPHAGQINALSTLNLRPATRKALGFEDRKARSMTDPVDGNPAMPDALEVAAAQDRQLAHTGKLVGPLQGVIMAVKDQYDTFDMRTTSGADAQYANDRPPHDATFVQRLRAAGAIVLAKSNLGEYASAVPRSSFGGTFCNPYDTERSPRGSSSGSGSSVAANLVTCAIAEETGSSIRGPASANNEVGLAPTQELMSRYGMMGAGINTRVGPICRTVEDVGKILDVIAGYDPKDELTVFSIGRQPAKPYASFAGAARLDGLRIGVVREYMNKKLFTAADAETIDIVDGAVADLRRLGATILDPGSEGTLFQDCIRRYGPQVQAKTFTSQFPELFPIDARGRPVGDHIAKLLDMALDPSTVPARVSLRDFGQAAQAEGEGKYMLDRYLRERGDANIKSNADLIDKSVFHHDPHFPDRRAARQSAERAMELDMSDRILRRFAIQQIVLQCMASQHLDALVYPTSNLPPAKLGQPEEPPVNGRGGVWSMLGQQGFPVMTVPAGFTTEVYDRIRDPSAPPSPLPAAGAGGGERIADNDRTRLVGPVAAKLPVGMDIVGRPFDEPLLIRIGSAYTAATHHRAPPPDFGPVAGEL
jgi:Asp-tRNA(Asn)/Glu-tRNA(Gln) amidotransferase A subunit family amidase